MSDPITRLNAALEGRYRIERQLGEGGMATVYLADDLRHERKVALKVLKPELAAVVGADRFLAEIKTTANLQHPHILPLFDSGEADGFLFYVMPYVEGESLRERLDREHQLPVDEAVQIAKNVAEALDYAHRQGVIHRDIKPANILLQDGKPVISDFGIALAVGAAGGGRLTETGLSLGTPYYMSPEQATGDLHVGAATDIYALGCVLYEMLVGSPPFVAGTPQAVLGKIVTSDAPSARDERNSVPPNVDAAIRKALEKVPADRFRSAEELSRALSDTAFRLDEARGSGERVQGTHQSPLTAALAVLVVVLSLAVGALALRPNTAPAVARFDILLPPGVGWYTASQLELDVSPDGSRIVFIGQSSPVGGRGGLESQLYLRRLDQLTAEPIPGTEGATNPRFSPDGVSVAFTVDTTLVRVATDGTNRQVLAHGLYLSTGIAWAPDGMIYVGGVGEEAALGRLPEEGGDIEILATPEGPNDRFVYPELLPGGRDVAFRRTAPIRDIAVLSLETGEVRRLVEGTTARYAASGHLLYTTTEGQLLASPFDVGRMEVTGPSQTLVENLRVNGPGGGAFAISGDGTLVYRVGDGIPTSTPVWLGRDGSEEQLGTGRIGHYRDPAISPDGQRVAFSHRPPGGGATESDIWIYDSGTFTPLTRDPGAGHFEPFWSPDGAEVAFSSSRAGAPSLYTQPWDGSLEARPLVPPGGNLLWSGEWTPDGYSLIYQENLPPDPTRILHIAPGVDSASTVFVESAYREMSPSVSPDGAWVAYASDQSGRYEVYVRPFPGPGGRIPISIDGGIHPRWAHSGREIFYRGLDLSWQVAGVRTEPDFAVQSRTELGPGGDFTFREASRQYDISPDDQRILALRAGSSTGAARYVLVQNFHEELNRLVPAN